MAFRWRLAGLPKPVITRAGEILAALERDELTRGGRPSVSGTPSEPQQQLGLFQAASPADAALREKLAVDVDHMTPLEARRSSDLKTIYDRCARSRGVQHHSVAATAGCLHCSLPTRISLASASPAAPTTSTRASARTMCRARPRS
jgi:hypothetical protein